MPTRSAEAVWEGGLRDGKGQVKLGSGVAVKRGVKLTIGLTVRVGRLAT